MTRYQAHIVLNEVRDGVIHPDYIIIKALVATGDINARCFNVDSPVLVRLVDRSSALSSTVRLPIVER